MHQLTHNMTRDCSWNYHENYKRRTWAEHEHEQSLVILWVIDARISASEKYLPVITICTLTLCKENISRWAPF